MGATGGESRGRHGLNKPDWSGAAAGALLNPSFCCWEGERGPSVGGRTRSGPSIRGRTACAGAVLREGSALWLLCLHLSRGGISALRPPSDGCQQRAPPLMPSRWPRPEAARRASDRRLDGPDRVGRTAIPVIEPRNKSAQIEPGSSSYFD